MVKYLNKKNILVAVPVVVLFLFTVFFIYIKSIENIETSIIKLKENQIQDLKPKLSVVPKIIDYSKRWIIGDIEVIKNILKLGILYDAKNENIHQTYLNQIRILFITNEIVMIANKHVILQNDKTFQKYVYEFNNLYKQGKQSFEECKIFSKQLTLHLNNSFYGNKIKINNLDLLLCDEANLMFNN